MEPGERPEQPVDRVRPEPGAQPARGRLHPREARGDGGGERLRRERGDRRKIGLHPREEVVRRRLRAAFEPDPAAVAGAEVEQLSHVLRAVLAARRAGDLEQRAAAPRVEAAERVARRRGVAVEPAGAPEARDLPAGRRRRRGRAPPLRVTGAAERLRRHPAGGLVLAVAGPLVGGEDAHDHLRPEAGDDAERVGEQLGARPAREGLRRRTGEAEIAGPGEVLPPAVPRARGEELFAAQEPEPHPELAADQVLPPFAAGEGEVRRLAPHPPRHGHQRRSILVVRVGADDEEPAVGGELRERVVERRQPPVAGRRERRRQEGGRGGGKRTAPGNESETDEEEREEQR
ncbi:MAG: hypothetical protein BWX64_02716 [Acidobacteria bacterium ADurb.Bin051]|nr:MAG: hypothetical protein BWX64_02716 [Acidobacteria bacterium ADurb.Bin051]